MPGSISVLKPLKPTDSRSVLTYAHACSERSLTLLVRLHFSSFLTYTIQNYALFVATVAVGNLARLPPSLLNKFVAFWLVSRSVYNILYIKGTTTGVAGIRSLTYLSGESLGTLRPPVQ